MTEVMTSLMSRVQVLLAEDHADDTEHTARILASALVAALEGRMVGAEVTVIDQDGCAWIWAHRGVPGLPSSLQPIARVQ